MSCRGICISKIGLLLFVVVLLSPMVASAAPLTQAQSLSLVNVVKSSPETPASAFTDLITAFSNITVDQAKSLIGVVQAAPNTPSEPYVNMLVAFTEDTFEVSDETTQQSAEPKGISSPTSTTTPPAPVTPVTSPPVGDQNPEETSIHTEDFDSFTVGSSLENNGWESVSNAQNYIVQSEITHSGSNAVHVDATADNVTAYLGNALSDGLQSVYLRTEDRDMWGSYNDGNLQFRVSKGPWAAGTGIFAAVSFKSDGNVAFYNPANDAYENFSQYADDTWVLLEVEWRSEDNKARYRVGGGAWTDWVKFNNSPNFVDFDHVGFDFVLPSGSGGVYIDSLQ